MPRPSQSPSWQHRPSSACPHTPRQARSHTPEATTGLRHKGSSAHRSCRDPTGAQVRVHLFVRAGRPAGGRLVAWLQLQARAHSADPALPALSAGRRLYAMHKAITMPRRRHIVTTRTAPFSSGRSRHVCNPLARSQWKGTPATRWRGTGEQRNPMQHCIIETPGAAAFAAPQLPDVAGVRSRIWHRVRRLTTAFTKA